MMRYAIVCLSALMEVGLLLVAPAIGGEDKADELQELQGTWTMVSMEIKGFKIPFSKASGRYVLIEGTTFWDRNESKVFGKGTIKINAKTSPQSVDAEFSEGPPRGKTSLAILEVKGDTLTACAAEPGKERPSKFTTKEGTGHMLVVYKKKAAP